MDNRDESFRVRFSDSVYKLLQDDIDNPRAKRIIDSYNELMNLNLGVEQENEEN